MFTMGDEISSNVIKCLTEKFVKNVCPWDKDKHIYRNWIIMKHQRYRENIKIA